MTKRLKARLDQTRAQLAVRPLREEVVDAAFERFRESGELPEDTRLAEAVTNRALQPRSTEGDGRPLSFMEAIERLRELAARLAEQGDEADGPSETTANVSARRQLFHEAIHGDEFVRDIARGLLLWCVGDGADVTDPDFLSEVEVPRFGCLSLHMLGFPARLAKPPHVRQARRLIGRLEDVRRRIDHDDPEWRDDLAVAIDGFRTRGEIPPVGLERDCALVDGELHALMAHYVGKGDPELIAAFDRAARSRPEDRERALQELSHLVRAGRLFPARI